MVPDLCRVSPRESLPCRPLRWTLRRHSAAEVGAVWISIDRTRKCRSPAVERLRLVRASKIKSFLTHCPSRLSRLRELRLHGGTLTTDHIRAEVHTKTCPRRSSAPLQTSMVFSGLRGRLDSLVSIFSTPHPAGVQALLLCGPPRHSVHSSFFHLFSSSHPLLLPLTWLSFHIHH